MSEHSSKTPFYITTPIYYVNDVPHIGHAYTTVAADVLARYHRLRGEDVFFLTGLDEHGQKVQQAAEKAGINPKEYCDRLAPKFQNLWGELNISNDGFIRTTDAPHKKIVQDFLQQLYDKKLIYRADYSGWYCTFDERFWTEKDVTEGLCPDCHRPVEQLSESNYFFKMGQFQQQLITYIENNENFIQPTSRRNEVHGFLQKPLEDLSISRPKRRLSWGIELPFDQDYVTYVWVDALANYISALDYLPTTSSIEKFWPANIHLVGKDILTTHAVYWSTILFALNKPLPKSIFAHGWWTVDGEKMSKSRGNVVDPYHMIEEFGVDAFRYFLLREVPFGHDGDFSRDALIGRINSDLANGLGNLLSRTLSMIQRFADGVIPEPGPPLNSSTELGENFVSHFNKTIQPQAESLNFHVALGKIWERIMVCDQYIDVSAPWKLAKQPEERQKLDTVLYTIAEALRIICLHIYPFMPQTAEEMAKQLGLGYDFSKPLLASEMTWGDLKPGTAVAKGSPLFPRIDIKATSRGERPVSDTQEPTTTPTAAVTPAPAPPSTETVPQITIEDFQKIQLKSGKILTAERVPKSNKLIKLQVDIGSEQRQIVAGIGKKYEPEALVGKTVVIVANLKPAMLMGVESQGMVLAAGDKDVLGVVTFQEEVDPGARVK